jgi:hypothetical protein
MAVAHGKEKETSFHLKKDEVEKTNVKKKRAGTPTRVWENPFELDFAWKSLFSCVVYLFLVVLSFLAKPFS